MKKLFNPFVYVAGIRALLVGLIAMICTAVLAYLNHIHFDGAIDVHFSYNVAHKPFTLYLAEPLIDWLCVSLLFYITGVILSRSSIRIIDVMGTLALSRWPLLFVTLLGFIPAKPFNDISNIDAMFILQALLSLPFCV